MTDTEQPPFNLEPEPLGLLPVALMAQSLGISRQALHAWSVTVHTRRGREAFISLADVIYSRREAQRIAWASAQAPDDQERARLLARRALLTEQTEALRLKIADLEENLADREQAAAMAPLIASAAADQLADQLAELPARVPGLERHAAAIAERVPKHCGRYGICGCEPRTPPG